MDAIRRTWLTQFKLLEESNAAASRQSRQSSMLRWKEASTLGMQSKSEDFPDDCDDGVESLVAAYSGSK